jgi:hypothetical protein
VGFQGVFGCFTSCPETPSIEKLPGCFTPGRFFGLGRARAQRDEQCPRASIQVGLVDAVDVDGGNRRRLT